MFKMFVYLDINKHVFEIVEVNIIVWRHKQSKKVGKDQESMQSSTTRDPGYQWEIDKLTVRHHKREPRGQSFPSR